MPFIRVKSAQSGVKYDVNVAHIVDFSPSDADAKQTSITMSTGNDMLVAESAQAVRGAIRRAENPFAAGKGEATTGEAGK